jgi:hypothetical protein
MASFLPEWRRDALEKKLSHAYGSAEDLPAILAALARSESACLGRIVEVDAGDEGLPEWIGYWFGTTAAPNSWRIVRAPDSNHSRLGSRSLKTYNF